MDFKGSGDGDGTTGGQTHNHNNGPADVETTSGNSSTSPEGGQGMRQGQGPSSGIPRPKKNSSNNYSKSVIYGSMSNPHHHKARGPQTIAHPHHPHLKAPWVHAPGKATASTSSELLLTRPSGASFQHDHDHYDNHEARIKGKDDLQDIVDNEISTDDRPPKFKTKDSRSRTDIENSNEEDSDVRSRDQISINYDLEGKDSLSEVTEFLKQKRAEIVELWEHFTTLGVKDPSFLNTFETANRLALEAANEVEALRISIKNLHEKDESLSDGDCDHLDNLRKRVLNKVQEFEAASTKVQEEITIIASQKEEEEKAPNPKKKSQSSQSVLSSKNSKESIKREGKKVTNNIKKSKSFGTIPEGVYASASRGFEVEDFQSEEEEFLPKVLKAKSSVPRNQLKSAPSKSNTTATTALSAYDLAKLTRLYEEQYEMPPVPVSSNTLTALSREKGHVEEMVSLYQEMAKMVSNMEKNAERSRRRKDLPIQDSSDNNSNSNDNDPDFCDRDNPLTLYKTKVRDLQTKLIETEAEVGGLKADLHRVENESEFQVKFLKSRFEDRLENLENFPEYLYLTENVLQETKEKVEQLTAKQGKEVGALREEAMTLKMEVEEAKRKGKEWERERKDLNAKLEEVEKANCALREELNAKNDELVKLKKETVTTGPPYSHGHGKETQTQQLHNTLMHEVSLKNQKMEMKIMELKGKLARANKNAEILQATKEKMEHRLTQHQEDLLAELENARHRNRQLHNQMHYLRTNYHKMFPSAGAGNDVRKKKVGFIGLPSPSPHPHPQARSKTKKQKHQDQLPVPLPVDEPQILRTATWVTGTSLGADGDKAEEETATTENNSSAEENES